MTEDHQNRVSGDADTQKERGPMTPPDQSISSLEGAFTRGPWTVERYGDGDSLVIHSGSGTRICFMATPGDSSRAWSTIKANARLIAAAPALVEALRKAVSIVETIARDIEDHIAALREEGGIEADPEVFAELDMANDFLRESRAALLQALGAEK